MAPAQAAPPGKSSPADGAFPTLAALQEQASLLYRARAAVGSAPPQPATLRGRIGAVLVRGIRRTLFWLIPQIDAFNRTIAEMAHLQLALEMELIAAHQNLGAALNRTNEEARQHQAEVRSKLEGFGGELQAIRDLLIELGVLIEQGIDGAQAQVGGCIDDHKRACAEGRNAEAEQAVLEREAWRPLLDNVRQGMAELRELQYRNFQGVERRIAEAVDCCTAMAARMRESFARESPAGRPQPEAGGIAIILRELETEVLWLKTQMAWQDQKVSALLEEFRSRWPQSPGDNALLLTSGDRHRFETLTAALQAEAAGSPEQVMEALRTFLPVLREVQAGDPAMPVLDVGCGRGEWLELLQAEGLAAQGVDHNREQVAACLKKGLQAVAVDAFEYLSSLPASSIGALTAFHFVEYLSPEQLMVLFEQAARVLKPGGVAIFETPNPDNLLVGAAGFYADITRRRPVSARPLRFLAEKKGLSQVQVLPLTASPDSRRIPTGDNEELIHRFNELFYGPQEYAIIGRKG